MAWQSPYAQPAEQVSYMGDATATDNAELTLAIEATSRSVDRACDRQFGLLDAPQIPTDDFATADGLVVETVGPQSDTVLAACFSSPLNALANGSVWTSLIVPTSSAVVPGGREGSIKGTAKFGWPDVPPTIKLATMIQASRLYARRHAIRHDG